MNASVYRLSLDIHEPHYSVCLDVKRGDTNSRLLLITLSENGVPYHISPECYAVFTAEKPDGNIVFNHCTIDGDQISYVLTPQTVAAEGRLDCEIKLYGADDKLITSPCFDIIVRDTVYNEGDKIESEKEVDALTHLISEATTVITAGKATNEESKSLIADLEAKQKELDQKVYDASESADVAAELALSALRSKNDAGASAETAVASAETAVASKESAVASAETAVASANSATASATAAKASEEAAKKHSDSVNPEEIDAKIAAKADDLYFDPETSLLYLLSDGQIVGSGVQVATTGGGGSGTLSYLISMTNLLESRVITVSEGTKVELKFTYASVDEEGYDDGPGIGKIIVNNATRETFTAVQGENTKDITPFLSAGSNTVKVQVENSESAKKTLTYTITVAAAYMTSAFDVSAPFTGEIPFIYTPTGIADKIIHFELDGAEIGTALVTASGRQQTYTIPAQSHGSHILRAWFECEIEGAPVTSNVISFALICTEEGKTDPIVAVNTDLLTNVEQYTNIVTKYRVYNPAGLTAAITLEANGEVVKNLTVDRTEQTWTYRPTAVGKLTQTIRCGDEYVSWTQTVTESTIKVEAETEALALHLSSYGRSNNEENPGAWESGHVSAEFQNFNFVSDGWKQDEDDNTVLRVTGDARLHIPYRMFAYDFRTTGKTIEFEMATREVLNYDAEVVNCFNGDRGFTITAQQLKLASEQSQMGTRYKEDEHLRVTFVVEKKSSSRLLLCYINGIMSGAAQYPTDDDFSQADPVGITIGSNECTTDLYNIRVYDNDLTRYQVLDNWIADTQNPDERMDRYLRNQIYDAYGRVVIAQLPNDLCYLVIRCSELPQYKGDKKTCSGYFVDLVHPERSFTFNDAQIDVQGTSSQYYWRKNYKIKFKGGFILYDGTTVEVYAMNDDAIPVSTFTMKADVASSEGYYNVVSAKLYNKYHPFTIPAQEEDPRVRYSIDGFPMVIFWDNGEETKFMGKYNFNNDKGVPESFGLANGDERWEVLQNGTARVGFHSADFSDASWKEDFEGNYPDGNTNLSKLQPMCAWVTSTDTDQATGDEIAAVTYDGVEYTTDTAEYRLAKFSAELSEHFVEEAAIYYYVFTEAFLCMDQREKNVLWRYVKALLRWLADYYDADSIIGYNNQAQPVFDYWMEDIDYTASGDPVFNGQNSTFWKNLRATRADAIKGEWHRLRDAGFSYETVMAAFEEHKSKWPEAIYNEDMQAKCLDALIENGDGTYLSFLRGDKWSWTQQWLYKRFRYLDSKYEYGTSLENRATIRTNVMANIIATYYIKMYGNVYYNAEHVPLRVEKDTAYEFVSHATGAEDRVIGINDADMITSIGDLSVHQVELIDLSKMVRLQSIKLGDGTDGYVNNALTSVTFGNNTLLQEVDIRNCTALTQALDMSGCTNIEEVYLDGTSITGLTLPNGGILKVLHLPATVTNLTVLNQKAITDFTMAGYSNVTTLRVENSPAVPALDILNGMPTNSRVRIIGFHIEAEDGTEVATFLSKLNSMRGLDENGNNVDKAQVSGSIHVGFVTPGQASAIKAAKETYPSLSITYDEVGAYLTNQLVDRSISGAYENDRVTSVGAYAFYNATNLTSVSFPNATSVGDYVFNSCTGLTYASFPALTSLGRNVFENCTNLEQLDAPHITSVGYSFINGTKITEIVLPEITEFGGAFCWNTTIKKIVLPKLTKIGTQSFMGSSVEALILSNREQVVTLVWDAFNNNSVIQKGTGYIYVPKTMADGSDGVAAYKAASNWSTYATQIRAIEDYPEICGGEV